MRKCKNSSPPPPPDKKITKRSGQQQKEEGKTYLAAAAGKLGDGSGRAAAEEGARTEQQVRCGGRRMSGAPASGSISVLRGIRAAHLKGPKGYWVGPSANGPDTKYHALTLIVFFYLAQMHIESSMK
jgi:hypothetical protein